MEINFQKYQGTGNDFVILDNRVENYNNISTRQIEKICDRRFGIGADGLIMLCDKAGYDFEMKYFNANGREGTMCGNGARCVTRFAHNIGIAKSAFNFLACDGAHTSSIVNGLVNLQMANVPLVDYDGEAVIINTGSPHYVLEVSDVDKIDVVTEGRKIRFNEIYGEKGINVNFVQRIEKNVLKIRTYERGVEDETLSCGTGVTASAIAFSGDKDGGYEFDITAGGGRLKVRFTREGLNFTDVWLCGPAEMVFEGKINI